MILCDLLIPAYLLTPSWEVGAVAIGYITDIEIRGETKILCLGESFHQPSSPGLNWANHSHYILHCVVSLRVSLPH